MRTRHLALGAALAAGALLLAGCSGTSDAGSDSTDGTGKTLTLWHYEGEDSAMGKAWSQAIADFEKETGAKVKFEASNSRSKTQVSLRRTFTRIFKKRFEI